MESQVMTLQKENRLLKQTLRESRKHISSRVSSKLYFRTIMSMCKDKSNDIIKKFQKTIPLFHGYDVLQTDVLGSGAYGTVRRGYIKSMQLKVAVKSFSESSKNRHIIEEGLIYSEISGNPHFPFFYGMIKSRFLIIECIDNSTTLCKSLEKRCFILKWEYVCLDIVRAVYSLHLKGILHSDLHCNNVLLRGDCHVKIIDFEKCTLIEDPVIYAIKPGSEKQNAIQ